METYMTKKTQTAIGLYTTFLYVTCDADKDAMLDPAGMAASQQISYAEGSQTNQDSSKAELKPARNSDKQRAVGPIPSYSSRLIWMV
jgi:hypothetical protein